MGNRGTQRRTEQGTRNPEHEKPESVNKMSIFHKSFRNNGQVNRKYDPLRFVSLEE